MVIIIPSHVTRNDLKRFRVVKEKQVKIKGKENIESVRCKVFTEIYTKFMTESE